MSEQPTADELWHAMKVLVMESAWRTSAAVGNMIEEAARRQREGPPLPAGELDELTKVFGAIHEMTDRLLRRPGRPWADGPPATAESGT